MLTKAEREIELHGLAEARAYVVAGRRALVEARMMLAAQPGDGAARAALDLAEAGMAAALEKAESTHERCLDDGQGGLSLDLMSRSLPVGLLPLRIETRYSEDRTRLMIRAWPDDIHIDTHDRALSQREAKAAKFYFEELDRLTDEPQHRELWRWLVSEVGLRRAQYVATDSGALSAGYRPAGWSLPATLGCMPDRLSAHLWFGQPMPQRRTPADMVVIAAHPVSEALVIGPSPQSQDGTLLGADAAWMHDFGTAVKAGMALEVDLSQAPPDRVVHRLVVLGLRSTVPAVDQARELAGLLRSHDLTRGIDVLSAGAATNLMPGAVPEFGAPDADMIFDDDIKGKLGPYERRPSRHEEQGGDRSQGYRTARALGLPPDATGRAAGSGVRQNAAFQPMRQMLGLLTRPVLTAALAPGVAEVDIDWVMNLYMAEDYFDEFEPLPHLLVGQQPYGILPVALSEALPPRPHDGLIAGLRQTVFAEALAEVPRPAAFSSGTARQALLSFLRSDAIGRAVYLRPVLTGSLAAEAEVRVQARGLPAFAPLDAAYGLAEALGAVPGDLAAMGWVLIDSSIASQLPLVRPSNPNGPGPATWLDWVAGGIRPNELLAAEYPGGADPGTLLFHLCRELVLTSLISDSLSEIEADPITPSNIREDAREKPETFAPGGPHWAHLVGWIAMQPPFGPGPAWQPQPGFTRTLAAFEAIRKLIGRTEAELEDALICAIDLLSHRLDAWITRDASERLSMVRGDPLAGAWLSEGYASGINLGAYGIVENLAPRSAPVSAGYLMAPSLQQAVAGAVLLSADLADWLQSSGSDFAVDLSSDRVRAALWLADGLRQGQPLGALLGYQIERKLTEAGAGELVLPVRALAPLVPQRLTPTVTTVTQPATADAVVDGLALLGRATPAGSVEPEVARLGLPATLGDLQPLQMALGSAAKAVDSLSDLLLAEGVYQMVRGNYARAQAATNAMSGVPVLPDAFEVVQTPVGGTPVTHRMLLLLDGDEPKGWNLTPRAEADPEANAWAGRWLPDPERILLRVRLDGATTVVSLADLLKTAKSRGDETLGLSPLDMAALAERAVPQADDPLVARLADLAGGALNLEPDPDQSPDAIGIAELQALAHQLGVCLLTFRPVAASEFPGAATPAEDVGDERVRSARESLEALDKAAAQAANEVERLACLRWAVHFGIMTGAEEQMDQRIALLRGEIAVRLLPFDPSATARDKLRQLFGARQPAILPLYVNRPSLTQRALKVDPEKVRGLVQLVAKVRTRVQEMWHAFRSFEIIATDGKFVPVVLPELGQPQTPWIGLPTRPEHGRTETILWTSNKQLGDAPLTAALFVDAWTEVVPDRSVNAALAFHFDAPSTAAPNLIVVGSPASMQEGWSLETLVALVEEALNLGKMRMIDPELLGAAGQFLPALALHDGLTEGSALRRMVLGGAA
jgi:hypothetical protein